MGECPGWGVAGCSGWLLPGGGVTEPAAGSRPADAGVLEPGAGSRPADAGMLEPGAAGCR